MTNQNLISPHGGYKNLKSFQNAEIIYDLTMIFTKRFIPANSRTRDQMEQAARSGTRNIGEGSQTSGTSKQSELRLIDVARSSLAELLDDYQAFLRQHNLKQWNKNDPRALAVRQLVYRTNRTYKTYMTYMSNAESAANCLICLINQTTYLLDQQMKSLEKELMKRGDFKDRYREARKNEILGLNEDYDGFLKQHNLKRLENGRVVAQDDPSTE